MAFANKGPFPLFCDSFIQRNLILFSEYFIHLERQSEYHFKLSGLGRKECDTSGTLLEVLSFLPDPHRTTSYQSKQQSFLLRQGQLCSPTGAMLSPFHALSHFILTGTFRS